MIISMNELLSFHSTHSKFFTICSTLQLEENRHDGNLSVSLLHVKLSHCGFFSILTMFTPCLCTTGARLWFNTTERSS